MSTKTKFSKRKLAHADLLKAALARPGVHETMQVYCNWIEKDQGLNPYRSVIQKTTIVTTTNSSNIS